MQLAETKQALQTWRGSLDLSRRVGLVPTMGCLHDGHLSLVRALRGRVDEIVVSIFVNPLQFAPHEDFDRYPRTFDSDCRALEAEGVNVVFCPSPSDFYPAGFQTKVRVPDVATHFEGEFRPGFFEGVATVCLKLFQNCQPHVAVFGEKDYQQLQVVRTMVRDLDVPLQILGGATIREADGLAMSSRNRYLSESERAFAAAVPKALQAGIEAARDVRALVGDVTSKALAVLEATPFKIDYLDVSGVDLVPAPAETRIRSLAAPRIFFAGKIGTTRLIDNMSLGVF